MDSRSHSRKLRVVQVISHLDLGGAEEVAISLAEALHQDVDFTFFVVIGGPRNEIGRDFYLRLQRCGIPVYLGTTVPMKLGGAVIAGAKLNLLLRRLKPDVVHVHTEVPEMTYAVATLFGLPGTVKPVRTIHNTTLWPAWAKLGAWSERRLQAARVAAVSQGSLAGLKTFQNTVRLPHPQDHQADVIYAGVFRTPVEPRVTRVLDRSSAPVRVLFAARFEYQKGVDLLPAIIERAARDTRRAVEFHIAGSGTEERALSDWAQRQQTGWKVTLGGPIPNLSSYLHEGHHDIVLMPSRFEGLSLVAVESLLAGVPVVATRIDGLMEVFPETYSLLAPSEDVEGIASALVRVIHDLDRARAEVETMMDGLMERFSLEGMGANYLRLYGRTVQSDQP